MLKTILAIALPIAAMGGCAAFDASASRVEYRTDITFAGDPVVTATTFGRLGTAGASKIVGYYGGGSPRFIGFGCDDAQAPVIAMTEDELNHCERVAPVNPGRVHLQTR